MSRCERCNSCQSMWNCSPCKRCNNPRPDTRSPEQIEKDDEDYDAWLREQGCEDEEEDWDDLHPPRL